MAFQNNGKLNGISKQWQNDTFYVSNFFNQVILTTVIYFFIAIRYKKFRVFPIYIFLTSSSFPRKTQNIGGENQFLPIGCQIASFLYDRGSVGK